MNVAANAELALLQERLGLRFGAPSLLEEALTHRSYLNEHPLENPKSNERLEFLGDACLGLVVARHLVSRYPHLPEGDLTLWRAALVRGDTLARVANVLGLGGFLRLGSGEEQRGGRERPSILAATLEAVVGAVYQDRGFAAARGFIMRVLRPEMRRLEREGVPKDVKSALQEVVQAQGRSAPVYRTIGEEGAEGARRFVVEVAVEGVVLGRGEGHRKADAERAAAQEALKHLGGAVLTS